MTIYLVIENRNHATNGEPEEKVVTFTWDPSLGHMEPNGDFWMGPGAGEEVGDGLTYIRIPWDDVDTIQQIKALGNTYVSPQTEGVKSLAEKKED